MERLKKCTLVKNCEQTMRLPVGGLDSGHTEDRRSGKDGVFFLFPQRGKILLLIPSERLWKTGHESRFMTLSSAAQGAAISECSIRPPGHKLRWGGVQETQCAGHAAVPAPWDKFNLHLKNGRVNRPLVVIAQ